MRVIVKFGPKALISLNKIRELARVDDYETLIRLVLLRYWRLIKDVSLGYKFIMDNGQSAVEIELPIAEKVPEGNHQDSIDFPIVLDFDGAAEERFKEMLAAAGTESGVALIWNALRIEQEYRIRYADGYTRVTLKSEEDDKLIEISFQDG